MYIHNKISLLHIIKKMYINNNIDFEYKIIINIFEVKNLILNIILMNNKYLNSIIIIKYNNFILLSIYN